MALKFKVDSLEGIDEALHAHYKESDGGFVLDVAGSVSKTVLENEQKDRRKAEAALKTANASLALFADTDLDDVAKMRKQNADLLDAKGKLSLEQLTPEQRQEFRDEEFPRLNKEHESALAKATNPLITERDEYKTRFEKMQGQMVASSRTARVTDLFAGKIDAANLGAATLYAERDLVYAEDDNRFYTKDDESDEVWAEKLMSDNPHWLPRSVGSGARGASGTAVSGSERERAYAKAEAEGDLQGMAKFAPVSE
jgi:hypothetical protein